MEQLLSVVQQAVIMHRQGVEVPLLESLGFNNNRAKGQDREKSIAKAKAKSITKADRSPKGET